MSCSVCAFCSFCLFCTFRSFRSFRIFCTLHTPHGCHASRGLFRALAPGATIAAPRVHDPAVLLLHLPHLHLHRRGDAAGPGARLHGEGPGEQRPRVALRHVQVSQQSLEERRVPAGVQNGRRDVLEDLRHEAPHNDDASAVDALRRSRAEEGLAAGVAQAPVQQPRLQQVQVRPQALQEQRLRHGAAAAPPRHFPQQRVQQSAGLRPRLRVHEAPRDRRRARHAGRLAPQRPQAQLEGEQRRRRRGGPPFEHSLRRDPFFSALRRICLPEERPLRLRAPFRRGAQPPEAVHVPLQRRQRRLRVAQPRAQGAHERLAGARQAAAAHERRHCARGASDAVEPRRLRAEALQKAVQRPARRRRQHQPRADLRRLHRRVQRPQSAAVPPRRCALLRISALRAREGREGAAGRLPPGAPRRLPRRAGRRRRQPRRAAGEGRGGRRRAAGRRRKYAGDAVDLRVAHGEEWGGKALESVQRGAHEVQVAPLERGALAQAERQQRAQPLGAGAGGAEAVAQHIAEEMRRFRFFRGVREGHAARPLRLLPKRKGGAAARVADRDRPRRGQVCAAAAARPLPKAVLRTLVRRVVRRGSALRQREDGARPPTGVRRTRGGLGARGRRVATAFAALVGVAPVGEVVRVAVLPAVQPLGVGGAADARPGGPGVALGARPVPVRPLRARAPVLLRGRLGELQQQLQDGLRVRQAALAGDGVLPAHVEERRGRLGQLRRRGLPAVYEELLGHALDGVAGPVRRRVQEAVRPEPVVDLVEPQLHLGPREGQAEPREQLQDAVVQHRQVRLAGLRHGGGAAARRSRGAPRRGAAGRPRKMARGFRAGGGAAAAGRGQRRSSIGHWKGLNKLYSQQKIVP